MIPFFISFLTCLGAFFRSRYNLGLEILALRQQLGVLKRKRPHPRLQIQGRMLWILLRRLWPGWGSVLVIVKPETVVAWHRAGFRLIWRLRSRPSRQWPVNKPIGSSLFRLIVKDEIYYIPEADEVRIGVGMDREPSPIRVKHAQK